jgi:CheY-like chemotaxis protein
MKISFKNILHVDDDVCDHELFHEALKQISDTFHYVPVTDAREALDKLKIRKLNPDIVFLDLNMPKMNGREFLVEFKKCPGLGTIPVYIFSTSAHRETIESMKRLGAKDYITKPDTFGGLVDILSSVLFSHTFSLK